MTGVTINDIAEGIKVVGCGSVSWIFQDDKKESIEIVIEQVLHIPGLQIRIISHNNFQNKQDILVMDCMHKRMKLI